MSLLEQAKELLREASTMASGDVEGFAAVAFPIVVVFSVVFWPTILFRSSR